MAILMRGRISIRIAILYSQWQAHYKSDRKELMLTSRTNQYINDSFLLLI